jgi:hypothetical protein
MAAIYKLSTAQLLASQAEFAFKSGKLAEAEKLQRNVVTYTEAGFGKTHIVTAAALLDLVRILEADNKRQEAGRIRVIIRRMLDDLGHDHSSRVAVQMLA